MKSNDKKQDELFQTNNQLNYYISPQKDSIIMHQSNGIITKLTKYQDYQTIEKKKIIEFNKTFNTSILMDLMAQISNQINCFESSLKMTLVSTKEQQLNNSLQFQLIFTLTYEYGIQIRDIDIENSIMQINTSIIEILEQTYENGDDTLIDSINNLMQQHLSILE